MPGCEGTTTPWEYFQADQPSVERMRMRSKNSWSDGVSSTFFTSPSCFRLVMSKNPSSSWRFFSRSFFRCSASCRAMPLDALGVVVEAMGGWCAWK